MTFGIRGEVVSSLRNTICVPVGNDAKSITTSKRSAGTMSMLIECDRRRDQAQVGADQRERNDLRRVIEVLEPQRVSPGLRAVDEAEAVLAFLDVERGPDLAIDEYLVAEKRVLHRSGIRQANRLD